MNRYIALLIPTLLAGCGTLPQPFLGRPGTEGALLSIPPPPVLIIPPPHDAMLGDNASRIYAHDLADALVARDVPSLAQPASKFDWLLVAQAHILGNQIIPSFSIVGPTGKMYGHVTGTPVAAGAWADGDPKLLRAAATAAAPELARQLGVINANVQQSNPLSLENRPPRVMLDHVTGAPGDGDHALILDLRRSLDQLGVILVRRKHEADFVINGIVRVSPAKHASTAINTDVVELDWMVRNQSGAFIGKVSQLHELEPQQMSPYWGDVAAAAAEQAALGIKQVIVNATPKHVALSSNADATHPGSARSVIPPAQ
ncbi:hypothetical protein [Acidiphilium sp.]|uniref:hypothetical protein n=1 Tax=Acidiphilium sp. TaxID=527 RepID=UPI003CFE9B31